MGIYFTLPDTAWQVPPDPYHWGQEVLSITRCLLTRFCLEREKVHINKENKNQTKTTMSPRTRATGHNHKKLPQATNRRCSPNVVRTGH